MWITDNVLFCYFPRDICILRVESAFTKELKPNIRFSGHMEGHSQGMDCVCLCAHVFVCVWIVSVKCQITRNSILLSLSLLT